ncbi:MAG: FKBP-type peptidyl-prolyl cis-trans isomerase, partial [Euryarchaeota archaeon]|nr:FKBP-type peptidyl-prolyl cis-trans isomerase [Euryarchaeota archaeon]
MTTIAEGNKVRVHYRGTLEDGTEFDSSYERGEPIEVEVGSGQVIPGFNNALLGMKVGESRTVSVPPEQAYGPVLEEALTEINRNLFPEDLQLLEGMPVPLTTDQGHKLLGRIQSLTEEV